MVLKETYELYLNGRKPKRLPLASIFTALFLLFSPLQMSLMERGAVRPITAVAWTSNSSTCPKDFHVVGTEI